MSGQVEMQHPAHEPFIDPGVTFSDGVDGEGSVVASEEVDIDKLVHISLLILMIPRGIPPTFLHALHMLLIKLPGCHLEGKNPWFMVFSDFLIQELRTDGGRKYYSFD